MTLFNSIARCTGKTRTLYCCLFVHLAVVAFQPSTAIATEHDPGLWNVFTTADRFPSEDNNSRWLYSLDAQMRYPDLGSGSNQQLIRPAVGYSVRENLQVWFGYARFRTRNATGSVSDENRFFQQLNWTAGRYKGGTLTMRTRLLQRDVSSGEDLGLVFRFMTKYNRPIGNDGLASLILSVEPFIDLKDTDWGGKSGIAQNRAYVGVGWRISDKLTLETGYLNQYVWRDGREDVDNHVAVLNFKVKL